MSQRAELHNSLHPTPNRNAGPLVQEAENKRPFISSVISPDLSWWVCFLISRSHRHEHGHRWSVRHPQDTPFLRGEAELPPPPLGGGERGGTTQRARREALSRVPPLSHPTASQDANSVIKSLRISRRGLPGVVLWLRIRR